MWEDLLRVDWAALTHAYGHARDVPQMLRKMVSGNSDEAKEGWSEFWGAINHQGDYYDSTVAVIPFLIEAAADTDSGQRAAILDYFYSRWNDAPEYGGDSALPEPPGGVDLPTPMVDDDEFERLRDLPAFLESNDEDAEDEEFDTDSYRPTALCAWQTARAIQSGKKTFESLLIDDDADVASSAADLLMMWPDSRSKAKQVLIGAIENDPDPINQAKRILNYGVYGAKTDVAKYKAWTAIDCYKEVRAAAALAWAWVVDPEPLPEVCQETLLQTSRPDCDAFANLPWEGIYHRGLWILPANASFLILRLADNEHDELRWRAVQGLSPTRGNVASQFSSEEVLPLLEKRLIDSSDRVREAASFAISQQGKKVLEYPRLIEMLIKCIDDSCQDVSGHAARTLVANATLLEAGIRQQVVEKVESAADRFKDDEESFVWFGSSGIRARDFFRKKLEQLSSPNVWTVPRLLANYFSLEGDMGDSKQPALECDRRLVEAFTNDPEVFFVAAVDAIRKTIEDGEFDGDRTERGVRVRNVAVGAAKWAYAIGPAAKELLKSLDAMAESKADSHAAQLAQESAQFVRDSLVLKTQPTETEDFGNLSEQQLIKQLSNEMRDCFGVIGKFEFENRLYLWHEEYYSPRKLAIAELLRRGPLPTGKRMIEAMLKECSLPVIVAGESAFPVDYTLEQWRQAAEAAGGFASVEVLMKQTRMEIAAVAWDNKQNANSRYIAVERLGQVIARLSGRLVGLSDC